MIDRSDDLETSEDVASGARTGPLQGFRVLDLSAVVSGPMAAMVLADQGADVIKVEPPGWGDGIRGMGASRNGLSAIYAMINRNKRSIAINLKHSVGQELIRRLVSSADVVMQNFRPGKMESLGLSYAELSAINPRLVYLSITGMGEVGPLAQQRVYDYVIQALSGAVDAQGEGADFATIRTILYDKVTALTAAQGVTAALLQRERTDVGQHVKVSMLDTAVHFNWPELMWNYAFVGDGVYASGDLADMYQVARTQDGAVVASHLGADCSGYATADLLDLFAQHDVPVGPVVRRADLAEHAQIKAAAILQEYAHPRGGMLRQPRSPIRYSANPAKTPRPSADLGEHTVEILSELGIEFEEMQTWARQGAIG